MTLQAGVHVWVPCEVVSGPFADERNVRLESVDGAWSGFVDPRFLREDIPEGKTAVRATVVEIADRVVAARLPGHTTRGPRFLIPATSIQEILAP